MPQIFIHDVTLLDLAILTQDDGAKGKSWHVDVCLEGQKNSSGMLFDFSFAKQQIKSILDEQFDHKLHVDADRVLSITDSKIKISCPKSSFYLETYPSAVQVWEHADLENHSFLEQKIEEALIQKMPKNIHRIDVALKPHNSKISDCFFQFTHSLCSHCGNCQRFHGHSSFIQIYRNGILDQEKSRSIAQALNHKYLIWENHLVASKQDHICSIQYTGSQGEIFLSLPEEKVILLNCESTIENIAEHIYKTFCDRDPNIQIRVYEGLAKGAVYP